MPEKSTAAGLRTKKQSERCTNHLNHWHRHHSLRCSGGGWVLRLRLWRSFPGSGLGLVVWGQPEKLRSSVPWAGEGKAMSEGTQERQSATAGEGERRRGGHHRQLPTTEYAHDHRPTEGGVALAQDMGGEMPLAHLGKIGCSLCRLQVADHLLCGLRASGS